MSLFDFNIHRIRPIHIDDRIIAWEIHFNDNRWGIVACDTGHQINYWRLPLGETK